VTYRSPRPSRLVRWLTRLREALGRHEGPYAEVDGNTVALLSDGAAAFPAMLAAIAEARREVLLEMYWFQSDAIGRRFAAALAERARTGVRVGIVYDAVGSFGVDREMIDGLREAGCEVHEFAPVVPWRHRFRLDALNRRDHRKILVVDGHTAFTGGINLGLPWAPESEGGEGWRDDMVVVHGPAALALREVFLETWHTVGGGPLSPPGEGDAGELEVDRSSHAKAVATGAHPGRGMATRVDAGVPIAAFVAPSAEGRHGARVTVLTSGSRRARVTIRNEYLRRIRDARRSVFIVNSYFVPDRAIRRALLRAASRGVDVRVILPGLQGTDVPAVYFAARHLYEHLLRGGVALYEWTRCILHSKTAVIDGAWCTVGSYNLDWRSWRLNLEVNVAVQSAELGEAMQRRFEEDQAHCERVDLANVRFRPPSERLLDWLHHLFRRWL
jgi:cardiolipin synthase